MSDSAARDFDPYQKLLGIAGGKADASLYRLLGVDNFVSDPDAIEAGADRQMIYLRTLQTGKHADVSQKLLNEVAEARVTLLNPAKKTEYDRKLRAQLAASESKIATRAPSAPTPSAPIAAPLPAAPVAGAPLSPAARPAPQPASAAASAPIAIRTDPVSARGRAGGRGSSGPAKFAVPAALAAVALIAILAFAFRGDSEPTDPSVVASNNPATNNPSSSTPATPTDTRPTTTDPGPRATTTTPPTNVTPDAPPSNPPATNPDPPVGSTEPPVATVAVNPALVADPSLIGRTAGDVWDANSLGMKFVWCPPGEFLMGSPDTDPDARPNEKPQHRVRLTKGFWIGTYEVTQGEWKQVMGTEPWRAISSNTVGSRHVASMMIWSGANSFCQRLTEQERRAGRLPLGWEFALPTEAQWEYACRAGTTTRYSFGDDVAELTQYARYDKNARHAGRKGPGIVGQLKANAWGLFDMHGHVAEWCGDWHADDYYQESPVDDPAGPETGAHRILRGGSWWDPATHASSGRRGGYSPDGRYNAFGFRVALVPTGEAVTERRTPRPQPTLAEVLSKLPTTDIAQEQQGIKQKLNGLRASLAELGDKTDAISKAKRKLFLRDVINAGQSAADRMLLPLAEATLSEAKQLLEKHGETSLAKEHGELTAAVGSLRDLHTKAASDPAAAAALGLALVEQGRAGEGLERLTGPNPAAPLLDQPFDMAQAILTQLANASPDETTRDRLLASLSRLTSDPGVSSTTPQQVASPLQGKKAGDEWSANSLNMKFVWCPPGTFTMGSPSGEPGRGGDENQVQVEFGRGFYLGKHEATQGEWQAVMGTTPWKGQKYVREGATFPASYVKWDDAVEFCQKLSAKEGEKYRLPTEAEWEYACRAGTTTRYSFGNDETRLAQSAWYRDNAWNVNEQYAHEVGLREPNPWGLHDMHGNMWEWCSDWYGELSGGRDPAGAATGSNRVGRGGDWDNFAVHCRSAFRRSSAPDYHNSDLGFRVALDPIKAPATSAVGSTTRATTPPPREPASNETLIRKKAGDEWSANSLKMKFVWCPPGTFTMGSPADELGRQPEREAQVQVTLTRGYWLGKYEVTQAEWKQIMQTEPWKGKSEAREGPTFAASYISWIDAIAFCQRLTEIEQQANRLPLGWAFTLPTEAQWEFACRVGTVTPYSFGTDERFLADHAWFNANTRFVQEAYAHTVGLKRANSWGFHDMHGNNFEWCRDFYNNKLPGGTDPEVKTQTADRVVRGGGWDSSAKLCRSAKRGGSPPQRRYYDNGFRVALVQVAP